MKLERAQNVSNAIRVLARRAMKQLSGGSPGYFAASTAALRPVTYMRYAEFEAVLAALTIRPGMTVLDASSPQWLTLYLATRYPETSFVYLNILDEELDPYREIAGALGITNIRHVKGDLRALEFPDATFDRAISVSVIEHVYPEVGGDVAALQELERVLKTSGELVLTVPFKAKRNVVFADGPVYERADRKRNFYAREYDEAMFSDLVTASGLDNLLELKIRERSGALALDSLEWGWGRGKPGVRLFLKCMRRVERFAGCSLDGVLARRYLELRPAGNGRLVNIAVRLVKTT